MDKTTRDQLIFLATLTEDLSQLNSECLDYLAGSLEWRTYGKDGKGEGVIKALNDLDTDHLENILITQRHIHVIYSKTILHILKRRWKVSPRKSLPEPIP
jgi:hypothetical protein